MATRSVNPIIPGFAPDPSCIRVDDTYYLVNSAFQWFPNLPIYTSKDLVNWTHTANAINRREQLSFAHSFTRVNPPDQWGESMLASGGLYAPTIRHHDGIFYVLCTNVIQKHQDGKTDERQNFIVTSKDPFTDEWSDPIFFDFDGIDVSPFWDADGKSYIVGSAVPGPMTTIKIFEIDLRTGKKLTDEKLIWRGTGGVYPEGPHIYVKDGYYYLIISEGGCFEDHMITAARSKDLFGPYEAYSQNPLITAKNTTEYIRHIGHSDIFTDPESNWWLVLLGVRKDSKGRYLMGRETFLTPMTWPENGWPVITQPTMDPILPPNRPKLPAPSTEPISATRPEVEYIHLRDTDLSAYITTSPTSTTSGQTISLRPSPTDITSAHPSAQPTFLAKRIRSLPGTSSVVLTLPPPPSLPSSTTDTGGGSRGSRGSSGIKAGLALYKDEYRFVRVFYASSSNQLVLELRNAGKGLSTTESAALSQVPDSGEVRKVALKIEYDEEAIRVSGKLVGVSGEEKGEGVSVEGVFDSLDLTGLDFTGPVVGVFACFDGDDTKVEAGEDRQAEERVVFEEFVVE